MCLVSVGNYDKSENNNLLLFQNDFTYLETMMHTRGSSGKWLHTLENKPTLSLLIDRSL